MATDTNKNGQLTRHECLGMTLVMVCVTIIIIILIMCYYPIIEYIRTIILSHAYHIIHVIIIL